MRATHLASDGRPGFTTATCRSFSHLTGARWLALLALTAVLAWGAGHAQEAPPEGGQDGKPVDDPGLVDSGTSAESASSGGAIKDVWENFEQRIEAGSAIGALGPDLFGDTVDLSSGALSFTVTDVSLPGNSALPVAFTRTLTVANRKGYQTDAPVADWSIDLPSISGSFAPNWVNNFGQGTRCAVSLGSASPPPVQEFRPSNYWNGITLSIPGADQGELLIINSSTQRPLSGGPYYWMTNGMTFVSCLASIQNGTGQGFLAVTADGTKYWFDWMAQYVEPKLRATATNPYFPENTTTYTIDRRKNVLYATRVEDRFGNWVQYSYTNAWNAPARLAQIRSNDGRQLDVTYNGYGHVDTVKHGTRTWQYQYVAISGSTDRTLSAVVLPDASRWTLNFSAFNAMILYPPSTGEDRSCLISPEPIPREVVGTVTHPSGAQGHFTVSVQRHSNSNVPSTCQGGFFMTAAKAAELLPEVNAVPLAWDTFSIKQKRITGPNAGTLDWNYSYSSTQSYFFPSGFQVNRPVCPGDGSCAPPQCLSSSCAGSSTTTVTVPDGSRTVYSFGNSYRYNVGKLLRISQISGATTLQTEVHTYDLSQAQQAYPARFGTSPQWRSDGFASEYHRPKLSTTTTRGGTTFSRTVNTFDSMARPLSVTRASSAGTTRTDVTAYYDDLSRWVLNQIRTVTNSNTNLVESRTDYYAATALPQHTYAFGLRVRTYTYNADGTLRTSADGLNRTTTLANWKRGIPQSITYPGSASKSAVVNDAGWIDSVTDERSNTTSYLYDPLGRITRITYPAADTPAWVQKTLTYSQLTSSELGMPIGGWRRNLAHGRYRERTYYDALFRPVLVEEYDTTTGRAVYRRSAYDHDGRTTFKSYPAATTAASSGIHSTYDALGRLTGTRTSGYVTLSTIDFPNGVQQRITDADNRATTITYQAFDSPDYSTPIRIEGEENQTTVINRDLFGKITNITQSGLWSGGSSSATRSFTYDARQRLCRRVDPESGSTVWGYNAASEVTWEAKGQTGTGCPTTAPTGATLFTYTPRGWKQKDDYPGTAEDVTYGYDAAGNLTSVANPTATWTYTYNKRNLLETEQAVIDGKTLLLDPAYNTLGYVQSLTTPGQTISYAPDAWGRPTQLGSWVTGVQYHPNGIASSYSLGNGASHTQSLTDRQWPWRQRLLSGGTVLQDLQYGYSDAGDLRTITDHVDGTDSASLTYDGLHRLRTASGLWGSWTYTYDTLNNLRSRTGPGSLTYTINATSNRLTNISGGQTRSYSYNAKGEITGDGTKSFTLNSLGQIKSITGIATYAYDGNGRRIKTTLANGTVEYTLYTRSGQLAYREIGAQKTDFLNLNGQTLASLIKNANGTTAVGYLHPDLLGSPRLATNATGGIIWREHYDPYGRRLNGTTGRIGYTGHAHDQESGYTYMQARFYDAQVGRFLSTDPLHFTDDNPFSFNRYAYANNNPYKYTDPNGEAVETPWDVANIAMGVASFGANVAAGNVVGAVVDAAGIIIDTAATAVPGVPGGAGTAIKASRVTAKQLRNTERSKFAASKAKALPENGGKCNYCGDADSTVGDHIESLKSYADKVNAGTMTKAEAAQAAHSPGNVAGACVSCNADKSAKQLSSTPGDGKYVPPNPSPRIEEYIKP